MNHDMNHCDTCRFFRADGSYAVPAPPDIRGDCWATGPHCTYNPAWVKIPDSDEHYCAHWSEVEVP